MKLEDDADDVIRLDPRDALPTEAFPARTDDSAFGKWFRHQAHRHDPVGRLAAVALNDPNWPGGSLQAQTAYLRGQSSRDFVLATLRAAWKEFTADERRAANRARGKAAKQARKVNRPKRRKRR